MSFTISLRFPFRSPDRFPKLGRRVGHVDVIDAQRRQRVHHGVGHRRRRAVGAGFADTFDS